ncbi:MAG: hypothetical protein JWP27_2762 [Flaviaesturariibacter sp.]|nr:hypothetical protein [Flaviaesturariibacter sp.]
MTIRTSLLLVLAFSTASARAQDEDLLRSVQDSTPRKEYVTSAFKSSRVIMTHSIEMLRPGVLDFRILHRFGPVNGGARELFGLDGPASVRLGLDYGISKDFTVGLGRSTYLKELDAFLKYRLIQQATGPRAAPLSVVLAGGMTVKTGRWTDPSRKDYFSSRVGYYGQLIAGRKFSERFTLQIVPTIVHQNLVINNADDNDIFALGAGARLKVSKRVALTADYHHVFNPNSPFFHDPLSLGIDIETGGHVFQLHFTNAVGMNERVYLNETYNDWGKGDVQFGFNISRAFQLKKRK